MSSTKSPIASGPPNAGTHNSSMAQGSWRFSLYCRMIRAWRVGEVEFQCRLDQCVISQRLGLRIARGEPKPSLKGNMMNSGGKEECLQAGRSDWCGVQGGQGECWQGWRSAEWNWGAQIQAMECRQRLRSANTVEHPFHAEQRRKGTRAQSSAWNRGAPNRGRGGHCAAPILEDQCGQKRQSGVTTGIEERLLYRSSTMGEEGGGGYEAVPPCVIDECSGFGSNII